MADNTSQAVQVLGNAGFTAQQIEVLLAGRALQAASHSTSDDLLDEFASRCASTGMTADVAGWWAARLEQGFDGHPAARPVVERAVAQLGQAGISHGEGVALAAAVLAALTEIRRGDAHVIDTTAALVR